LSPSPGSQTTKQALDIRGLCGKAGQLARLSLPSGCCGTEGLAPMEFMQPFQLIVDRHELVADVNRILNSRKIIEHRLDLCLAGDQDAALG
jgi:hypothetical protein